jgi:ribonuclease Z
MLTEVEAGPYTLRGISVAGIYTSLLVPQLRVVLDAGIPIRSFASTNDILLSHAHGDHASGLASVLSIRQLIGKPPARVYVPEEIAQELGRLLELSGRLYRTGMTGLLIPVRAGETFTLRPGLHVRAFRTHHRGPSLGYQLIRRVQKLRPEFRELPAQEVARRRKEGDAGLFDTQERLELAYATDTLSHVLDTAPFVLESRVLILECTFVDAHRSVEQARERAHIHLDEIIERADSFRNEAIVLMHFSQAYSPEYVHATVRERLPEPLRKRVRVFAPESGRWFG